MRGTGALRTDFGPCSRIHGGLSRRLGLLLSLVLLPAGCGRNAETPIALENARAGSGDWGLVNPATRNEIEGYASPSSAAPGETVALHVSTASSWLDIDVYRLGWYGGRGARLVARQARVPGGARARPAPRPEDGLVTCAWPVSARVVVGVDWPTGVYLARLTASDDGKQAYVPFVIRERPDRRAPLLFPLAVSTWQAYNAWGGTSLYDFNSDGGRRALRVSFDRPYASGPGAWAGLGAGELLTVTHGPYRGGWEYPMIRWLERRGYDVAYATGLDLDADSALAAGRRGVILAGHDEYWSRGERDRLEAARDHGTGIACFGANTGYWQVRLEASADGSPRRVIFCSKDYTRDSLWNTAADRDLTVRFRDLHPRRPEVALLGVMTPRAESDVEADFVPRAAARGSWVYAGTGIAEGGSEAIRGLVGYEIDRSFAGDSLYARWSPPGLSVLARSPVRFRDGGGEASEATVYAAASGAVVFAAGTIQWAWGLDDWGAPAARPARASEDARRITRNVLGALLNGRASRAPGGSGTSPSGRSPG
ncbi:MAG TPA: N,N-dimethylformamidase beta subunit family domain-containing protein [Candidatus Eisenbacteria bacterium]